MDGDESPPTEITNKNRRYFKMDLPSAVYAYNVIPICDDMESSPPPEEFPESAVVPDAAELCGAAVVDDAAAGPGAAVEPDVGAPVEPEPLFSSGKVLLMSETRSL